MRDPHLHSSTSLAVYSFYLLYNTFGKYSIKQEKNIYPLYATIENKKNVLKTVQCNFTDTGKISGRTTRSQTASPAISCR